MSEQQIPILTVMGYRSMPDPVAVAAWPMAPEVAGGLALQVPGPTNFAARCVIIGIGPECRRVVDELACAPWFAHLRGTAIGPHSFIGQTEVRRGNCPHRLLEELAPHVVSIALPTAPTLAETDFTCELNRALRRHGAFVILTSACADQGTLARLGQACDCLVTGDGGTLHHHYPIRTVSEPALGRLVCYDLYDVCCLWAGRLGQYGTLRSAADALHVEISAALPTLWQVDALAANFAERLDKRDNLQLFNVVDGMGPIAAAPVSFRHDPLIRQDRVPRPM